MHFDTSMRQCPVLYTLARLISPLVWFLSPMFLLPPMFLFYILPPDVVSCYYSVSNVLCPPPPPFSIPRGFICRSNRLYCDIVRGMHSRGILACMLVGERVVVNGTFLVPKADGRYRLITGAQPANAHFVSPPYVNLPSPSDIDGLISSGEFYVANLDIDNYYHRICLPPFHHPLFALPTLPARLIGPL